MSDTEGAELATYLTGRHVEFKMAPFSYGEYIEAVHGSVSETGDALFMKYLETGGMPFLPQIGFGTTGARQYLDDLFWAILSKDIVRRKEFSALASVPDQYRKVVLSMDSFDFSRDGIEHIHLPDFLLDGNKRA